MTLARRKVMPSQSSVSDGCPPNFAISAEPSPCESFPSPHSSQRLLPSPSRAYTHHEASNSHDVVVRVLYDSVGIQSSASNQPATRGQSHGRRRRTRRRLDRVQRWPTLLAQYRVRPGRSNGES